MLRVAIIGGGAAGMGSAVALVRRGAAVELFEAEPTLGGHCYGITIPFDGDRTFRIDAGVSDFNEASFSEVTALVRELGLEYFPVCQDASFMTEDRQSLWFTQGGQSHFSLRFPDQEGFVAEAKRFNRDCIEVLEDASYADWSAERYLSVRGYSDTFRRYYFAPRAQGCFPMPNRSPYQYMIRSIVAFWRMHGIVGPGPARRMVVKGGMHTYGQAVQTWLTSRNAKVHLSCHVVGIARRDGHVRVRFVNRERANLTETFDQVVIATNANQVIPLLEDPAPEEQRIFSSFEWQRARVAVHQDDALMPADRSTWGAYNYIVDHEPEVRPTITFYPNRLAALDADVPDVFVTMNPFREPAPEKLIADRFFVHPSVGGIRDLAVERLDIIQGQRATWFCGGYLHEPFVHEQALRSGLEIGNRLVSKLAATSASPPAPVTEEPFSDFLNQVKMFSGLDPWALAELQLIAQHFSVEVGQTIFRQGDQADGLYVIKNGAVAVIRRMPGDESLRLATLGRGDVFGEAGLLDSGARSASAVSIEPTDGFFVSAERFATLRADMRPAALLVMRRFTREVADRTRKAVDNIVGPTAQRRCNAAATDWPALSTSERLALDVLSALPMLRKFKRPEIEKMSERLKWVRLTPGAVVARAGDRAERCLIVLRGACVTTLPMSHGNEPFAIHGPGSLIGELPLIDGGVHFGDCVAREETMAIVIEQSAFHELCGGQTSVEFKLFEAMTLSIVAQLRRANGLAARLAIGHRTECERDGS